MLARLDHRAELLSDAVELSRTLSRCLDQLGPNPIVPPNESKPAAQAAYKLITMLEEDLSSHVQELRTQRNAVVSPISKLPEDLLRQIFVLVRLRDKRDWTLPVIISHVSRSWRNIAINTAQLWSFVQVTVGHRRQEETDDSPATRVWHPAFELADQRINRNAVFLSRSKGASLDFTFALDFHIPVPATFCAHAHHIASLCLTVSSPLLSASIVIGCVSAVAPTLQDLSLFGGPSMPPVSEEEQTATMRGLYTKTLPLLRQATFDMWPLLSKYDNSFIFLMTCHTLKLGKATNAFSDTRGAPVTYDQVLTTLCCCPQVEEIHVLVAVGSTSPWATMQAYYPPGQHPPGQQPPIAWNPQPGLGFGLPTVPPGPGIWPGPPTGLYMPPAQTPQVLTMPQTKRLVLSYQATDCLQLLLTPNLKSLEFCGQRRGPMQAPDTLRNTLQRFLGNSSAALGSFTAGRISELELTSVFEALDNIRSLVIQDPSPRDLSDWSRTQMLHGHLRIGAGLASNVLPDTCLEPLVFSGSSRRLCPNLEELSYLYQPTKTLLQLLRKIAVSRKLSPTPLRKITLGGWEPRVKALYDRERSDFQEQALAAEVETLVIGDWRYDGEHVQWKPWIT